MPALPVSTALSRRLAALAIATVAVLGLTACTGSPAGDADDTSSSQEGGGGATDEAGDDGQSVEEACGLIRDTIEEASADLDDLTADDPAAAVDAVRAVADRIAEAGSQITNDQVAAVVPQLEAVYNRIGDIFEAVASGDADQLSELETIGDDMQTALEQFQELCA